MSSIQQALLSTSAGTSVASTWNPADKGASIILSGGNLIAGTSGAGGYNAVRSTISETAGKWYYEVVVSAAPSNVGAGAANALANLNQLLGATANGIAYYSDGSVIKGFAVVATYTAYTAADRIQVAVDAAGGLIWFGLNGAFNGNPAAGTGGLTLPTTPIFIATSLFAAADVVTLKAVASYLYTSPAGFANWT